MESESFSRPHESSPQVQHRRLKRLKKRTEEAVRFPQSNHRLSPKSAVDDDLIPFPRVDFARLQALEAAIGDSNSDDSNQPLELSQNLESESAEERPEKAEGNSFGFDDEFAIRVEDRRDAKRALDFDGMADSEKLVTDRVIEEKSSIEKKGKKRTNSDGDNGSKPGKRKMEKERKAYLKQLHYESQRLLRESTDAAFKPAPMVGKSVCDVLEKIRQRKMQVTKKITKPYNNASAAPTNINGLRDAIEVEEENESNAVAKSADQVPDIALQQPDISPQVDQLSAESLDVDKSTKSAMLSSYGNLPIEKDPDKSIPMLRAPIDDTQDIFENSQTKDDEVEPLCCHEDSPFKEAFVPSLSALNLKLDSVLSDDSSSEEDNDKENVDPLSQRPEDGSPRGDPVRAFVDEEAEEEDDSDHDMLRFPENEDDDMEGSEELNDIIATDYEERPIDNERRNELHQKWLEKQDAAGTDNLLQKLKVGLNQQETAAIGQEEEENHDIEEYNPEDEDDTPPKCATRVNMKKAKQMISQMFVEKDDLFLSDEDEETEKKLVKHRLLVRTEEQEVSVSSVQDESSREVFGLIRKLNIAPESRKKAKPSSCFDSVLKGGNGNSFLKSSFVGRFSSHTVPSCHKKSSGSVRSFIFGRDDSNSRNSISASHESEDTISKGNRSIRTSRAPPTCSQGKFSSQSKNGTAETASQTSLFDILKRSSMKTGFCSPEDRLDLTQVISNFKIPK